MAARLIDRRNSDEAVEINGGSDIDVILGSRFGDKLRGAQGDDTIDGNAGDDQIMDLTWIGFEPDFDGLFERSKTDPESRRAIAAFASENIEIGSQVIGQFLFHGGNDRFFGDSGDDYLLGLEGNDRLDGGSGLDVLLGGSGNDTMIGGSGNDIFGGGQGLDYMLGGTGTDLMNGGAGNDKLTGGAGADQFYFQRGSGIDRITDFEDSLDEIHFDSNKAMSGFNDMVDHHVAAHGDDLWITYGKDVIILKNTDANNLHEADFIFAS